MCIIFEALIWVVQSAVHMNIQDGATDLGTWAVSLLTWLNIAFWASCTVHSFAAGFFSTVRANYSNGWRKCM